MTDKEKIEKLYIALWQSANCISLLTSGAEGIYKEFGVGAEKAIRDALKELKEAQPKEV